jgi:hypothetical protein
VMFGLTSGFGSSLLFWGAALAPRLIKIVIR